MKITKIAIYQMDLPLVEGRYKWSNGNFIEVFDSSIIEISTDSGLKGYAECCPLGSAYLPSYAKGVRTGITEIAPKLIGENPLEISRINLLMDKLLKGHPYVKAPIDIACWDLLGKDCNKPIYSLLGGKSQDDIELYRAISQEKPNEMLKKIQTYNREGYTKFQLKVGGCADEDIERIISTREALSSDNILIADANTGWKKHDALRVVNAISNKNVYIEQPCASYDECFAIRNKTSLPFILDEVIDNSNMLIKAISENAMDIINLKITKVGGLTKARNIRDICIEAGIPMTIEDTWGGDITTATIAQLAITTPKDFCFSATDFNSYVTVSVAENAPKRVQGKMKPSNLPGLGVIPNFDILGQPKLIFK